MGEAPLKSDSSLKYINPTDPRTNQQGASSSLLDLPLFKEMEELRQQENISLQESEIAAILNGQPLGTDGLSLRQQEKLQDLIRLMGSMATKDLLTFVSDEAQKELAQQEGAT